ncbi:SirB2 family protein [Moraxella oblonga]|uniref:SirB2 family protein n=1 Tax=Moraxella oblonga TaxID=200413 RepID=UPI00082F330E|nr:SirB2 family protein [Moraxella oblonga]
MKHLHMLMAVVTIALYLYQVSFVVRGVKPNLNKAFKGASHAIYTTLVASGLYLFWQLYQEAGFQAWVFAKIVLLVMAVSANIKAIRPTTTLPHTKAGFLIAGVAYVGIVWLAIAKPNL